MKIFNRIVLTILGVMIFSSNPIYAQEDAMHIKITINGNNVYTAVLEDNPAVSAFKDMLPLTLDMSDFNGNEKKFDLSEKLPTKDLNPEKIETGDLMIWNSRTVVLFYKSFPTPYSYTKIGHINDASGLADIVGSGDAKITFELE